MIFPSWTNMVRVLYSADFFEWVTIIIVFFFSKFIFCNSSIISVPVFESRFPIGSSARITSGLFIRARAYCNTLLLTSWKFMRSIFTPVWKPNNVNNFIKLFFTIEKNRKKYIFLNIKIGDEIIKLKYETYIFTWLSIFSTSSMLNLPSWLKSTTWVRSILYALLEVLVTWFSSSNKDSWVFTTGLES